MSHPRVLLAKHDSHFLNSLSRVLSRQSDLPFDIAIASESTEAMSGPGGPYAALVCLVETPEQIPLLRRLKQQHGGLPLLALVPAAETTLAEEARRAGAEVIPQDPNPESTATLLQSALTLLINSRRTMPLAAEGKQKMRDPQSAIGDKRRILELSRSIAERPPIHQYPVLVIDDEQDAALLLTQALQSGGFTSLHHSSSFGDVVARLSGEDPYGDREKYPIPFLIFLNLEMAGRSGYEILQWLRSRPDLRNIIVVGHSPSESPEDIRRAYELGTNSYVTLPSTLEELQRLVQAVRHYWVRLNV